MNEERYLSISEVADRIGQKRATVRKWHERGQMPEPVALIGDVSGWTPGQIDGWWVG